MGWVRTSRARPRLQNIPPGSPPAPPGPWRWTAAAAHSRWASGWAEDVRTADVVVGDCVLQRVPVDVRVDGDWALWWVPHPHIGGTPMRYVQLFVFLDSTACRPATGY